MGFFMESITDLDCFFTIKKGVIIKVVISAIVCLTVGGLSGFATAGSIDSWYETINKSFFNQPNWVFGPVWTILYALIGVSLGIIWSKRLEQKAVKKALIVFGIHLVLNGLRSILFFGLQQPAWAFVEIIVLLISIFYFTNLFYIITPIAGWLQVPYILWVSFASLLNGSIARLN